MNKVQEIFERIGAAYMLQWSAWKNHIITISNTEKGVEISLKWKDSEVGPFVNLFMKCFFFFCKNEAAVHKNERAIQIAIW